MSWTASTSGHASGYVYELRTSGAAGSGETGLVHTAETTDTSVTFSELTEQTTYQFYVRTVCGEEDFSNWTSSSSFTLPTVTPVPWYEGFSTTTLPAQWTATGWTIGTSNQAGGNPGITIYKNLYGSAATGTFSTPNLGYVEEDMKLKFDYRLANYDSPYGPPAAGSGNFVVAISTDYGLTYTNLATVSNNGVAGWQSVEYDLAPYAGMDVKVRITANRTSGDYMLAFDNFQIGSCFTPGTLTVTNLTPTQVDFSWSAPSTAPDGYEWAVTTSATPPASGTATTGTSASDDTIEGEVQYY